MSDTPRFVVHVQPADENRAQMRVEAHAEGVTALEVAKTLLEAATALLRVPPHASFETVEQINARHAEAQFIEEHPATRMFVKGGEVRAPIWLGADVPEKVLSALGAANWFEAPLPVDMKPKACDFARLGEEALLLVVG